MFGVQDPGWELKSELGAGSWSVQIKLPFGRKTCANIPPQEHPPTLDQVQLLSLET